MTRASSRIFYIIYLSDPFFFKKTTTTRKDKTNNTLKQTTVSTVYLDVFIAMACKRGRGTMVLVVTIFWVCSARHQNYKGRRRVSGPAPSQFRHHHLLWVVVVVVDPAYQSPVPPLYHWAEKKREKNKYTHIFNLKFLPVLGSLNKVFKAPAPLFTFIILCLKKIK